MSRLFEHGRTGRLYNLARQVYYVARTIPRLAGVHPRECNVCGFKGKFFAFGSPPRFDARCPRCGSLERHRLLQLWVERNRDFVGQADVLHFAPEGMTRRVLARTAKSYKGADLNARKADLVLNIEAMDLPDASADLIVCSHVLEHVDDAKALREMRRVLTPHGKVALMFPIVEAWAATYENPEVSTASLRVLHFGQHDHVRFYGRDVRDRIRSAGFALTEFPAVEPEVSRYGLLRGETIFMAEKADAGSSETASHAPNPSQTD